MDATSRPPSFSVEPENTRDPGLELPERILIVEGDPEIRTLLVKSFARSSEVLEATDGRSGLEIIQTGKPQFVITDLTMPDMEGLEMIERARRNLVGACVPILVLTSRNDENVLLDAFRRGADDYMVKPFSLRELRMRVSSIHVRQRRASDVNPLTSLPGNIVLKHEISCRIRDPAPPIAVAYIDIDNFKAFNDSRGFDRGDRVIQLVGDLLRDFANSRPPGEIFVGHIGGDDFVVILPRDQVEGMAARIHEQFTATTRDLYTPTELERGSIRVPNRRGEEEDVPLMSLSIGVVSNAREGVDDLRRVAHLAAEVKKVAKAMPGNSLFIDRRQK